MTPSPTRPRPRPQATRNYVSHHNGAQYFGYIANNSSEETNMKGENDFFTDIGASNLPSGGGVFYIRGGYNNIKSQTPPIQNPNYPDASGLTATEIATIDAAKSGDDDHPSYSDKQLSEAMNARVINAIANSKYWNESAIILTYDESDGGYDHVPPQILSYGPDKLPLARGVRIPLLLISPYARAGSVSHAEGDHNAIIETINAIFGLPPLSTLPEEAAALKAGNSSTFNDFGPAGFKQKYLGPRDTNSAITDSLLSGFSPARLKGTAAPLPAWYATIPDNIVEKFPHYGGKGCEAVGLRPDRQKPARHDADRLQHVARDAARVQRHHSVNQSLKERDGGAPFLTRNAMARRRKASGHRRSQVRSEEKNLHAPIKEASLRFGLSWRGDAGLRGCGVGQHPRPGRAAMRRRRTAGFDRRRKPCQSRRTRARPLPSAGFRCPGTAGPSAIPPLQFRERMDGAA